MTRAIQAASSPLSAQSGPLDVALIARFAAYVDAKPRTVRAYLCAVRRFSAWATDKGIARPSREDLIRYRDELKAEYKAATVQSYIAGLRLFFSWLDLEGLYPDISRKLKGATVGKEHKKDYLTGEQVRRVLDLIDTGTEAGLRDYALIALMTTGGLRDIEAHRANISDISVRGGKSVLYVQGKGRDEKSEFVKLMPEVEGALRAYIAARGAVDEDAPLFTSTSNRSHGKRLSTRSISGIAKRRLSAAGYRSERLTAHSLRHTAVTLALIGGNSLQDVQRFARHRNIATTQIYAHDIDRARSDCERAIAASVFGI